MTKYTTPDGFVLNYAPYLWRLGLIWPSLKIISVVIPIDNKNKILANNQTAFTESVHNNL